jgi:uncharacterized damage-inducible protein DinB
VDRTAEFLRRVGAQANAAVQFAVAHLDNDGYGFSPSPDVPSVGWRVRHILGVVKLYVDHGFGGGGPRFVDYVASMEAAPVDDVLAELQAAQRAFSDVLTSLPDADLDTPRPTHWGGELPTWQVAWTVIVEQFHHAAEIGTLLDIRRGRPRPDDESFPEVQDGRGLSSTT